MSKKLTTEPDKLKHPIQPLYKDKNGTIRFKENAIVRFLLDTGGSDMNKLACMKFSDDDRTQFAQLTGYSLSGFGELSNYVSDESYGTAASMAETGQTEEQARIEYLEGELKAAKDALRKPMARLFGVHPDDLKKPE